MVAQLAVGFDLSGAEDQIGCGFLWEFRRGSLIFKHVNGFVAGDGWLNQNEQPRGRFLAGFSRGVQNRGELEVLIGAEQRGVWGAGLCRSCQGKVFQ